jgi:CRP/FNR family transcriptional regulator, anaerobic regulatory protein
MEKLLAFLHQIFPLPEGLRAYLSVTLKSRTIARKDFLLLEGQVCREIYFIEQGLVRSFYTRGKRDVTAWFMKEGDVVISINSFFGQRPSADNIQALEETTVQYVSYEELEYMYRQFLTFNVNGRKVLTHYYLQSEARATSMRAKERYEWLLDNQPDLLHRVARQIYRLLPGYHGGALSNIYTRP